MKAFTKLFSSIVSSSIWTEDAETRIVWVTMLALADKNGEVWASIGGLAKQSGVPRDKCAEAVSKFLAPDPDSRTKDNEGRRIAEIDGGWVMLNYGKYRELGRTEDRREYFAEHKRLSRSKSPQSPHMSTPCPQKSPIAEAEAEAEAKKDIPPAAVDLAQDIMATDQKTADKIAATEAVYSWLDWRREHPRIGIARVGEDGDPAAWKALWTHYGRECLDVMYQRMEPKLEPKKSIWYTMAAEWLAKNTTTED